MRNALAKSVRSGSISGDGVARNLEAMTTLFDRELLWAPAFVFRARLDRLERRLLVFHSRTRSFS